MAGPAHCKLPPARAPFALSSEACCGPQDRPQLDDGPPKASSRRRLEEALHFFLDCGLRRASRGAWRAGLAAPAARLRKPPRLSAQHVVVRALCTPPACSAGRAHAASLSRCAGPRAARLWSTAKVLAATDTCSSSCTRMTRPFFLTLRAAAVVLANARPRRCELHRWSAILCHIMTYHNSGVLWT